MRLEERSRRSYTARWYLISAWAGREVRVLIMEKTDSFLSVGLCRFLEFGG